MISFHNMGKNLTWKCWLFGCKRHEYEFEEIVDRIKEKECGCSFLKTIKLIHTYIGCCRCQNYYKITKEKEPNFPLETASGAFQLKQYDSDDIIIHCELCKFYS